MPRPTRSSPRIAHRAVVLALSPALACGSESVVPTGANPRKVTVSAGATATTTFDVACPRVDRIAFVSARAGNADIWVMGADGANPTRLTDDSGKDLAPRWAP